MTTQKLPCILVQNNAFGNLFSKVSRYGWDNNLVVHDRCYAGPSFDINDCGIDWSKYGPVLIYGTAEFVNACAKSEQLAKYVFNDRKAIAMSNLVDKCGRIMFNHHGAAYPAKLISEWITKWSENMFEPKEFFIRPDEAHKVFNGGVYNAEKWHQLVKDRSLPDDLMCWISERQEAPKAEYRCWVINGKIGAVSQYMEDGKPMAKPFTFSFKEIVEFFYRGFPLISILKEGLKEDFPECFTVDFAIPHNGSWSSMSVMEINCINSSGFYGFDNVPDILGAWMEYLEEKENNETNKETI